MDRRRGGRRRRSLAWKMFLLAALGFRLVVAGQLSGQPLSREAELEELRAEIGRLQSRLESLQDKRAGLEGELRQTELALRLQEARVAEARAERRLAETNLAALESGIERLEVDAERLRRAVQRRVVDLYRLGKEGYLRLLLSIRTERQVLPGIRQLRYLVRRDNELIHRYREARSRLADEKNLAVQRRQEVEAWQMQETARRDQLAALRRRQKSLLAQVEREREELAQRALRLADKERKLSELLDSLSGGSLTPLGGVPMQDFQGVLDWPVEGRITQEFGRRRDPLYRTEVPHNGLEFSTEAGSEVHAVYPGSVLFAAPFQGFGLTAILHHPGRIFTLYAGLEELKVDRNDMLSLGEVIGVSSEKIYFEIRVENSPVDPLGWLR